MDLLSDLREADSDHWYSPARTISSLGWALAAEKTLVVVVNSGDQHGLRALVRPTVESIAGRNADVIVHLQCRLQTEDRDLHLHATVEDFFHQLEAEPPKDAGGSPSLAARELVPAEVQEILDHFEALRIPLSHTEAHLVTRLLAESDTLPRAASNGSPRSSPSSSTVWSVSPPGAWTAGRA
ncbi:hypothetical protein [Plantibacter sp. YIM 135249]|uniref:hypothetical protein n=1 Tax=Plantibacter sp. YIM 135249 TaxID=3423918 RepID=UPI003D34DB90